jgi:signal transduction histidine kinase
VRLADAEATLEAIRTGQVDAVLVSGPGGERVHAIEGASHPYHELLNAMTDGAALLGRDGTMLFANQRLAKLAHRSLGALPGAPFAGLVPSSARAALDQLFRRALRRPVAAEFTLAIRGRAAMPVWIALSPAMLGSYTPSRTSPGDQLVLMAIVTDLTDRRRAEAARSALVKRLVTAENEERRRIARELHDETGQSLTALLVGLRTIEEQAVTLDVRESARRLRAVAARTLDEVGRLARGLHPGVLDDLGLSAAIRYYAKDYARTLENTLDVSVDVPDTGPLPSLVETTLYRVLQEALTNVARHAGAHAVRIALRRDGTALTLSVRDDGAGFDPAAVRPGGRRGLGLHGMHERVALLDGVLDIVSAPGQGTTVSVTVPGARVDPRHGRR